MKFLCWSGALHHNASARQEPKPRSSGWPGEPTGRSPSARVAIDGREKPCGSFDDLRDFRVVIQFAQQAKADRRIADVGVGVVGKIERVIGGTVAPRAAGEHVLGARAVGSAVLAVAQPFADVADEVVDAEL